MLCLLAWLWGACNSIEGTPATARNVLVVSIDTLRADRVGAYGHVEASTPTLDRLAADGTRFDAAFSPAPLTLPTHATLLTGTNPDRHGVRHNGIHRLAPEADTLGERFAEAGFETGAFVGSLVVAGHTGLAQGFGAYGDAIESSDDHGGAQRRAGEVNADAIRWLDGIDDPFLLFVHYYDPHRPYDPPTPWSETARSPYDGEISYADAMLGELLTHLESTGRLRDTLIVVTSDHGEGLGEHDELTHGHAIYDATQRVPLILKGPGVPQGRVVEEVVRTADIAPTLLSRMRLPAIEPSDGIDLSELWTNVESRSRSAYLESMATRYDHGWSPLFGLRTDEYLYIESPQPELYEVRADPAQAANLLASPSATHLDVATGFQKTLVARRDREVVADEQELDPETRAQLHALGYAIPESPREANGIDPKIGRPSLALFHEGEALYQSGQPREAAKQFEKLVAMSPASAEGWVSLGAARLAAGELEPALEATNEAVRWMPTRSSPRLQQGVIQMALGRPTDAEASFREAIELDPEAPGPRARLLRALIVQGKLEDALEIDRQITSLGWTNVVWLRRIADLWEAAERPAVALAAYERVLALEPDSPRDHMHVAIALIRLGHAEAARSHLDRAGDVIRQPRARAALEASYLESGLVEEARRFDERFPAEG